MWIFDYLSDKSNPYKFNPFVKIVHMSYIDNLPAWSYPWHLHEHAIELGFIVAGSGNLVIGNQIMPVEAGSITVVQPDIMHHFSSISPEGMKYYTIRFADTPEDNELVKFFSAKGNCSTQGINYLDAIQNNLRLLFDIHQANGGIVDEAFQSIVLGLIQLTRTLFLNSTLSVRLDEHFSVSDILYYISQNCGKKITLESLAKEFNISPSHLSRLFCNAYHMSPINYLIYSRVTFSTEYLLKSDLSIAEIAELVGYDNPAHFTNMFTKRIGCTPTEYREKNQVVPPAT